VSPELGRVHAARKSGAEPLHRAGSSLDGSILDFWQWSGSDLLVNTARGQLAEYIVAKALGISTGGVREAWAAFDLSTPEGVKVEVKSASYLQSWFQSKLSAISFSTKPSTAWNPDTSKFEGERRRQAEVYVFALLRHEDKATLDPLDITQWEFYPVATAVISRRKGNPSTITLSALQKLGVKPLPFERLAEGVKAAHCQ
jgi:hypothetical protein